MLKHTHLVTRTIPLKHIFFFLVRRAVSSNLNGCFRRVTDVFEGMADKQVNVKNEI